MTKTNSVISCDFCCRTNTNDSGRIVTHSYISFYSCTNCFRIICSECGEKINKNYIKNGRCVKCKGQIILIHGNPPNKCFITTATLHSLKKDDNCYELKQFREFRDNWMKLNNPELIEEYYEIAPKLVEAINDTEFPDIIYKKIWNKYLIKCLRLIENNHFELAKEEYCQMVKLLYETYK